MMKYCIEVTEVLSRTVKAEACNESEALNRVLTYYRNGDIVLDSSDYKSTIFSVKDEKTMRVLAAFEINR
ncbi:MAG: DpnD/PcfM family protein [Prevotella sp.]|nr:DpnD/PcfM family protein [Prevotella sp.]